MLRNYSERLHGREATRPDVTYTFGGAVVETTVEMPELENDPTKPRENKSFELKPGLQTEDEIKAYVLSAANNIDGYNAAIQKIDPSSSQMLTDNDSEDMISILNSEYEFGYVSDSTTAYFSYNGRRIKYHPEIGEIDFSVTTA